MLTDFRLAVRALRQAKGFTSTALVTLGLGLTLCIAAVVVIDAYLLSDLPYPAADRLYWIRYAPPNEEGPDRLESLDWRSLEDVIEHPVAWDLDMFYLLGGDHAESAPGAWVTPGFMAALGVEPARGRSFNADEFTPGATNVALISHQLWVSRFGSDADVAGRTFRAYVSDRPEEAEDFRIIGVLPERFWHVNPYTDVLVPLRAPSYPYMARLRRGVTPDIASRRIAALVRQGGTGVRDDWLPTLVHVHDAYVAQTRPVLRTVGTAAALVLVVACANVAGLLLVRALRRRREIAIRLALGSSRGAIARLLLAEALVLGGVATIVALTAVQITTGWLAPLVQQQLGRSAPGGVATLAVDARVMALAAGAGLMTVVVCALAPLMTLRRPSSAAALQKGSRGVTDGPSGRRWRSTLIALEIAGCVALLAGSVLMLRSVIHLVGTDPGFRSERVLNASLTLRLLRYPDAASRDAVLTTLAERLQTVPGVESAAFSTAWPVQQPSPVRVATVDAASASGSSPAHVVSDRYFETLGIPLRAGRPFTRDDRRGAEPVAILSESLAGRLWPDATAIGKHLLIRQETDDGNETPPVATLVVGVAGDVRQGPSDVDVSDVYLPLRQAPSRFAFVLMRTAGAPLAVVPAVRAAIREVDPDLVLHRPAPLQQIVDEQVARPRFLAALLACFAGIAAAMALVGVYGVIAYAVRQREREIALRLAVGATPGAVTGLFLRQGGLVVAGGIAAGLVAALGVGRVLESQLSGVEPHDPLTLAVTAAGFGAVSLAAVWWPARAAAKTDPAIALRVE